VTSRPEHRFSVDDPGFWSDRYRSGDAGWDQRAPTPVFVDMLKTGRFPPGRMLVPGCGTGHDALAFARAGFKVTGVDFAPEPLAEARALASAGGVNVEFVQADFFTLGDEYSAAFDYILEYVMYCAIHPSRRIRYAHTAGRMLKSGGLLIALFFPVEDRPDGPPFGVDMTEAEEQFRPLFRPVSREIPAASIMPRRGREVLAIWERLPQGAPCRP
jgi:SAM-dependent methyltransferase